VPAYGNDRARFGDPGGSAGCEINASRRAGATTHSEPPLPKTLRDRLDYASAAPSWGCGQPRARSSCFPGLREARGPCSVMPSDRFLQARVSIWCWWLGLVSAPHKASLSDGTPPGSWIRAARRGTVPVYLSRHSAMDEARALAVKWKLPCERRRRGDQADRSACAFKGTR
jgi:hypothetical protein